MTDLGRFVRARTDGFGPEFACETMIGSEVLAAVPAMREEEILERAARAVELEVGMAEIHAGDAAGVDQARLLLTEGVAAKVWLDRTPSPQVVVWLA